MHQHHRENLMSIERKIDTNQPFSVTLKALLIKPLHSNNNPQSRFGCSMWMFINPSLKNRTKTTLPQDTIRPEIPRGSSNLIVAKAFQVGRLQYFTLTSRSNRYRRWWVPASRADVMATSANTSRSEPYTSSKIH